MRLYIATAKADAGASYGVQVMNVGNARVSKTLADVNANFNLIDTTGDGRILLGADRGNALGFWDLETGAVVATFTCDGSAYCCAFACAHGIVAGDSVGRVHLLELMEKS